MKTRKWSMIAVAVVLLAALTAGVLQVNSRYPNPRVVQTAGDETMDRDDVLVTVTAAGFLSRERSHALWEMEQQVYGDVRGYAVTVQIVNNSTQPVHLSLGDFVLSTDTFAQSVDLQMFLEWNEADIKGKFQMQPGASFTCTLPYMIPKVSYRDKQWLRLEEQQFKLILSLYPIKREILL